MLENEDALQIVKADLANLVTSARKDNAANAEVSWGWIYSSLYALRDPLPQQSLHET